MFRFHIRSFMVVVAVVAVLASVAVQFPVVAALVCVLLIVVGPWVFLPWLVTTLAVRRSARSGQLLSKQDRIAIFVGAFVVLIPVNLLIPAFLSLFF
jgi:hypothetical protein